MKISDNQRRIAEGFIKEDKELVFFSNRNDDVVALSQLNSLSDQRLSALRSEIMVQLVHLNAVIEDMDVRIQAGQAVEDSVRTRKRRNCLNCFIGTIKGIQKDRGRGE